MKSYISVYTCDFFATEKWKHQSPRSCYWKLFSQWQTVTSRDVQDAHIRKRKTNLYARSLMNKTKQLGYWKCISVIKRNKFAMFEMNRWTFEIMRKYFAIQIEIARKKGA